MNTLPPIKLPPPPSEEEATQNDDEVVKQEKEEANLRKELMNLIA